ncbi:hypothetical protein [Bosea sp. CS1GBMeth4]|nr:hypothetical protein [Bosea sp. CS1GBMeth4]
MISRNALWIAVAAVVAIVALYAVTRGEGSRPGQPPPHAIDQSRRP